MCITTFSVNIPFRFMIRGINGLPSSRSSELKACNRVNLYFFMNYFYRVRLSDGIVPYLLKSEVVEEDLSIWSNIELVWMESQLIFTALLLRQQSSVFLDHGLGWNRKDNVCKTIL